MGTEKMSCCGELTRTYTDAGHRTHAPDCPTQHVPVESVELITSIMAASASANFKTMDTLYEREREVRQALEMLIDETMDKLDAAYMGSAREYENALKSLRRGVYDRIEELAARHPENELS